jgi:hypothetical protein
MTWDTAKTTPTTITAAAATTITVFERKDTALYLLLNGSYNLDMICPSFQSSYIIVGKEPPTVSIPMFYISEFSLSHPPHKSISISTC